MPHGCAWGGCQLPLHGAALYWVMVWSRLQCQLALGSAGWLSLLSLSCDHLKGGHTTAWEGCVHPLVLSPGSRAMPRPAWGTGSPLSTGAEQGQWPCSSFWKFPRGWTAMLWGMEGGMYLLTSCQGTGSMGMGVLELGRDPTAAGAVSPTGTPCSKLPCPNTALLASPGTGLRVCPCCHPPGWEGWTAK